MPSILAVKPELLGLANLGARGVALALGLDLLGLGRLDLLLEVRHLGRLDFQIADASLERVPLRLGRDEVGVLAVVDLHGALTPPARWTGL
jgi:hypothetical protein